MSSGNWLFIYLYDNLELNGVHLLNYSACTRIVHVMLCTCITYTCINNKGFITVHITCSNERFVTRKEGRDSQFIKIGAVFFFNLARLWVQTNLI